MVELYCPKCGCWSILETTERLALEPGYEEMVRCNECGATWKVTLEMTEVIEDE